MHVTVLGRHAPYAPAGGACNGYLVEGGGAALLLDGGPGAVARLQERLEIAALNAVVVSHLHEDHIADLYGLQFPIWEAIQSGRRSAPLSVYAPLEPGGVRRWLEPAIAGAIALFPLTADVQLAVGGLTLRFHQTDHTLPCYASRISDGDRTLVYTGDTGTGADDLAAFAVGADLLLTEATFTEANGQNRRALGHLSAAEAAWLARRSGAGRLLLTHLHPAADLAQLLAEATAVFPATALAEERRVYRL